MRVTVSNGATEFLSIFGEDLDEVDIFFTDGSKISEREEPCRISDFSNQ